MTRPAMRLRVRPAAIVLLLAGLAAATALAQAPTQEPAPQARPPGPEVMYSCPGGTDFSATFSDDGNLATLTVPGQPEIELPRQPSGNGFLFSDSYFELRGRGREATLTAAGRSMRCHAVGRPGEPPRTYAGDGIVVTLFPDGIFRLRDTRTSATPVLDIGQWAQEVDGGVRMVLRGGAVARRAYREAGGDRLIDENGTELQRQPTPDPIEGTYRVTGLYRDTNSGSLFTECLTGRTFEMAAGGAEPELERVWTEVTPSKEASLFVEIEARFGQGEIKAEKLLGQKRDGTCPPAINRGAALRDTEWRLVEIDNEKPSYEDWRQRPRLRLDDDGRYGGSAGCNALSGSYQLDPDGLRFLAGASTQMACPPAVAQAEQRFLAALYDVRQAQLAGTTLDLLDGNGKRRLRFEARGR